MPGGSYPLPGPVDAALAGPHRTSPPGLASPLAGYLAGYLAVTFPAASTEAVRAASPSPALPPGSR